MADKIEIFHVYGVCEEDTRWTVTGAYGIHLTAFRVTSDPNVSQGDRLMLALSPDGHIMSATFPDGGVGKPLTTIAL